MYEALGTKDIDMLLKPDDTLHPKPKDPATENSDAIDGKKLTAFDGQQHDARRLPQGCQSAARIPRAAAQPPWSLKMLVRLLYASRAVPAVDQEELAAILRQSKSHNPAVGVTGVLCFSGGIFLQVLEGGRSAVNRLYNRIVTDPRHTDVELLSYQEIEERRFAGWSMGQVNMARLNPALLLKYSETARLDPYAVSGTVSLALFEELVATAAVMGHP
jgi:hypothetical protein